MGEPAGRTRGEPHACSPHSPTPGKPHVRATWPTWEGHVDAQSDTGLLHRHVRERGPTRSTSEGLPVRAGLAPVPTVDLLQMPLWGEEVGVRDLRGWRLRSQ